MIYDAKQLKEMSNAVRAGALRAILSARSGHLGIVLGAADIVTTIYANFLRRGTDRFVLSAGHGSALLYSVLKLAGYDIGNLTEFRHLGGLPGHPEYGIAGVDATTGPLGQGVGNAVGYAIGEKIKKSDARVYCLCGDGDLMEGVAQESIAFAGRNKLNNLVLIWDDNGISIDGVAQTDINIPMRMRAAGWHVTTVQGNDFNKICRAIADSKKCDVPTFIQAKTKIGAASSVAGTARAHGYGLDDAEIERLIDEFMSPAGLDLWAEFVASSRNIVIPVMPMRVPDVRVPYIGNMASTRELSGKCLAELMNAGVRMIGGSADLAASTNVKTSAHHDICPPEFDGDYINYGVREHAMGAIMNGLAADGLRPYGSTFLVFSDYMRPSIRLAAMSGLPVIYVFTHDSIYVGEDGPTHQPIEQLPSLRLIPNINVFRPCNGAEVMWAWRSALADTQRPTCLILSRQKFAQLQTPADADISRGAYIIYPAGGHERVTLIATGAEVPLAVTVAKKMGRGVQVVSMPSVEKFRAQDAEYKKQILRGYVVAIEAAATAPWFEFADAVVGIDKFGASGPGDAVYAHFGFNADTIARDILGKIK